MLAPEGKTDVAKNEFKKNKARGNFRVESIRGRKKGGDPYGGSREETTLGGRMEGFGKKILRW